MGIFSIFKKGLKKTRDEGITAQMDEVIESYEEITDELFDELEEILIMGDVGMPTAERITPATAAPCPARRCTRLTIPVTRPTSPKIRDSPITKKSSTDKMPNTREATDRLLLFLSASGSCSPTITTG